MFDLDLDNPHPVLCHVMYVLLHLYQSTVTDKQLELIENMNERIRLFARSEVEFRPTFINEFISKNILLYRELDKKRILRTKELMRNELFDLRTASVLSEFAGQVVTLSHKFMLMYEEHEIIERIEELEKLKVKITDLD